MIKRVMLDTSAYNELATNEKLRKVFNVAQKEGLIQVITTEIQISQINETTDQIKKESMLRMVNSNGTIETSGYFPGISRSGWFNLGYENNLNLFLSTKQNIGEGKKKDALIGSTALAFDIFVTNDEQQKKTYSGIDTSQFEAFLNDLLKDSHN